MGGNLLLGTGRTTITTDAIIHVTSGYYALTAAEYRVNNEHPPLAKMWSALPLVFLLDSDPGRVQRIKGGLLPLLLVIIFRNKILTRNPLLLYLK